MKNEKIKETVTNLSALKDEIDQLSILLNSGEESKYTCYEICKYIDGLSKKAQEIFKAAQQDIDEAMNPYRHQRDDVLKSKILRAIESYFHKPATRMDELPPIFVFIKKTPIGHEVRVHESPDAYPGEAYSIGSHDYNMSLILWVKNILGKLDRKHQQ